MSYHVLDQAYTRCCRVDKFLAKVGLDAELFDREFNAKGLGTWQQRTLYSTWARSALWMMSLTKLTSAKDYQAICTAGRSLFELCMDGILLAHRDDSYAMRFALSASSERYDMYRRVSNFFREQGKPIPERYVITHEEVAVLKQTIEADRLKHWPEAKGRHPKRETGQAAREVDIAVPDLLIERLGISFTEFYQVDYRLLSSLVHSGVAGIDGMSWRGIEALTARSLNCSWVYALITTEMLARHGGFGRSSGTVLDDATEVYRILATPVGASTKL